MTAAIVINDGLAVLRARLERDLARFSLRSLVDEINKSPHVQIWVFDGPKNKELRRQRFPEYKLRRKAADPSIWQGLQLMKEVLKSAKGLVIEVPGYEADDVIATLATRYAGKHPIAINTRDFDLRALCALHPTITCTVDPKADVEDKHIRLYKTTKGDPSDCVPGIKGFGEKAWQQSDKSELQSVIDAVVRGEPLPVVRTIDPKHLNWIEQNRSLLHAFWDVIGFYDVPENVLSAGTTVGHPDAKRVDAMLSEFFL